MSLTWVFSSSGISTSSVSEDEKALGTWLITPCMIASAESNQATPSDLATNCLPASKYFFQSPASSVATSSRSVGRPAFLNRSER